jgi:hypothetical protein
MVVSPKGIFMAKGANRDVIHFYQLEYFHPTSPQARVFRGVYEPG